MRAVTQKTCVGSFIYCFLPSNTTSILQILDLGIIKNLKLHFCLYFLMYMYVLSKMDEYDTCSQVSQLAIRWVPLAWSHVTVDTIMKYFWKAGILDTGLVASLMMIISDERRQAYCEILVMEAVPSWLVIVIFRFVWWWKLRDCLLWRTWEKSGRGKRRWSSKTTVMTTRKPWILQGSYNCLRRSFSDMALIVGSAIDSPKEWINTKIFTQLAVILTIVNAILPHIK